MKDQDVKNAIRTEVTNQYAQKQFGQNQIPRHVHNGTDAPPVFSPTRLFAGYVPSDANIQDSDFIMFPKGWSVTRGIDNTYEVTHNLGTEFYSVTVCQTGPGPENIFATTVNLENSFQVVWFTPGFVTRPHAFQFVLTQINNKTSQFVSYNGNDI